MAPASRPSGTDVRPTVVESVVEAVIAVVACAGFDAVTVRAVATEAQVSIGAVQHHFPTKEAMLQAASDEVSGRIQARVDAIDYGPDARENLVRALSELLPLDTRRRSECRVHLAFAAAAATRAPLAAVERAALHHVRDQIVQVLRSAESTEPDDVEPTARALVALADGLALHGVSTTTPLTPGDADAHQETVAMCAALERGVTALLASGRSLSTRREGRPG